jgi:CxxC-x17-CxxC domain-containing protein
MSFQDKALTCIDCGSEFVFTAGEQQFYQERGFDNEPRRCKACRSNRKASGGAGAGYGAGGNSGGASGGAGGGGRPAPGPRGYGGGPGGAREFFDATCSACGGSARLPFQPSADRPVYCRSCYQGRSGPGGSR